MIYAVEDPGVRGGTPDAGKHLPDLTANQAKAFEIAKEIFEEVASVDGSIEGEDDAGLGPTFNLNSCVGCHAQPSTGGTSPRVNPQIEVATLHGARNTIPSFITRNGPVREVRYKRKPDGSPDGGVHGLFVITGRSDAPAANRAVQPNFAAEFSRNNLSFRIPTPVFGLGLVEAIPEEAILANKAANADRKNRYGIAGRENRNGNDGTISRFGWKAQNKSLMMFSGEAYNVEMGITNELFPNARESGPGWSGNADPEDSVDLDTSGIADVEQFAVFMRLLAAPVPDLPANVRRDSVDRGKERFDEVGCVLCHTESLTTGKHPVAALTNKKVSLYSDLLLHNMGPQLADDISQGVAAGDEFRTAPLWGLGQRIFFLHDGRTRDLIEAIQLHASEGNGRYRASEANRSVQRYNELRPADQQDLLNFLRSL